MAQQMKPISSDAQYSRDLPALHLAIVRALLISGLPTSKCSLVPIPIPTAAPTTAARQTRLSLST
jgi:hypothetical protein